MKTGCGFYAKPGNRSEIRPNLIVCKKIRDSRLGWHELEAHVSGLLEIDNNGHQKYESIFGHKILADTMADKIAAILEQRKGQGIESQLAVKYPNRQKSVENTRY